MDCEATAFESDHHSHDHCCIRCRFLSSYLSRPTTTTAEVPVPTLNMRGAKWLTARDDWKAEVAVKVDRIRQDDLGPLDTLDRCWRMAYDAAFNL
eukprot:3771225-Rhodomonas_salina.1